jgi:hypothetical protein
MRWWLLFSSLSIPILASYHRATGPGVSLTSTAANEIPSDFVIVTEDGEMRGFDSCGTNIWRVNIGRVMSSASAQKADGATSGPRMVPAVDGSMYVVFPPNKVTGETNIAHVNTTIMSVVAESPFSTPAFPNAYLTGSKIQSIDMIEFNDVFNGWIDSDDPEFLKAKSRLSGRKLMYTTNQWMLSCIDTSSQEERWYISFTDIPSMTSAHLITNSIEHYQVEQLSNMIEIVTSRNQNRIVKRPQCAIRQDDSLSLSFDSQIVGVYALIDPPDTNGNLALVLVGKNTALPTNFGGLPSGLYFSVLEASATHKGVPETDLLGIRVGYEPNGPVFYQYDRAVNGLVTIRSNQVWDPSSMTPYLLADPGRAQLPEPIRPELIVSQFNVWDFLSLKFSLLPWQGKLYLITMMFLLIYVSRIIYRRFLRHLLAKAANRTATSTVSIILPDRGQVAATLSSPASTSSNRMVVIPTEAIHPYEVLTVGHSDSVEFSSWQKNADVLAFDKKIRDISDRLTKLPFAPSRKDYTGHQSIEDSSNMTVLFLGRNVDEPKLVFRNPRAETVVQRSNIPIYTQSIRNAVAASALRDNPAMKAYVPRALCGYWNTFQGVFQEYIVPNKTSVTISALIESPQMAIDTAFLVMLVRDTDAHEGNYVWDIRRKIALFDLGCSLADSPLPATEIDRICLDNFEIWKRVPFLLDEKFDIRHRNFLNEINLDELRRMWKQFEYHQSILGDRLVHPLAMLRMLEIHAKFLAACIDNDKTVLFASEVLYSGLYDDVWLECGIDNLNKFEDRLVSLATSNPFPNLEKDKGKISERAMAYSSPESSERAKDD